MAPTTCVSPASRASASSVTAEPIVWKSAASASFRPSKFVT